MLYNGLSAYQHRSRRYGSVTHVEITFVFSPLLYFPFMVNYSSEGKTGFMFTSTLDFNSFY